VARARLFDEPMTTDIVIFPVSSYVLPSENWACDLLSLMSCGCTGLRDGTLKPVDPGWAPGTPKDPPQAQGAT
jgi:hypothetical protein